MTVANYDWNPSPNKFPMLKSELESISWYSYWNKNIWENTFEKQELAYSPKIIRLAECCPDPINQVVWKLDNVGPRAKEGYETDTKSNTNNTYAWPHDMEDSMLLEEVSMVDKDAIWIY